MKKIVTIVYITLVMTAAMFVPHAAFAAPQAPAPITPTPQTGAESCGTVKTSFKYNCSGDPGEATFTDIALYIFNFAMAGVGIACLGGMVFGGLTYARAAGNAELTKKGIAYIMNALIALLLFFFLFAILNFLVPGGLFT